VLTCNIAVIDACDTQYKFPIFLSTALLTATKQLVIFNIFVSSRRTPRLMRWSCVHAYTAYPFHCAMLSGLSYCPQSPVSLDDCWKLTLSYIYLSSLSVPKLRVSKVTYDHHHISSSGLQNMTLEDSSYPKQLVIYIKSTE
jgi:hypothetical protein